MNSIDQLTWLALTADECQGVVMYIRLHVNIAEEQRLFGVAEVELGPITGFRRQSQLDYGGVLPHFQSNTQKWPAGDVMAAKKLAFTYRHLAKPFLAEGCGHE